MLSLDATSRLSAGSRILCLGAHCDDIEIGAGATILTWLEKCPGLEVDWIVFSSNDVREAEARKSAKAFLANAKASRVEVNTFRNGYFPYIGAEIKDYFEHIKQGPRPDIVLTHHREDLHQDHRVISDLTWNTFRDHLILEYEIPKFDDDTGTPNMFVEVSKSAARRKVDILMDSFASEKDKLWFDERTFLGLMRLRGVQCQSQDGLAEAFYGRKIRL